MDEIDNMTKVTITNDDLRELIEKYQFKKIGDVSTRHDLLTILALKELLSVRGQSQRRQ